MKLADAMEDLSYLSRSLDLVEDYFIRIKVEGQDEVSVQPLGPGTHSPQFVITSLVAASNIGTVTEVFFHRFEG